jgi:hypothetical protein
LATFFSNSKSLKKIYFHKRVRRTGSIFVTNIHGLKGKSSVKWINGSFFTGFFFALKNYYYFTIKNVHTNFANVNTSWLHVLQDVICDQGYQLSKISNVEIFKKKNLSLFFIISFKTSYFNIIFLRTFRLHQNMRTLSAVVL